VAEWRDKRCWTDNVETRDCYSYNLNRHYPTGARRISCWHRASSLRWADALYQYALAAIELAPYERRIVGDRLFGTCSFPSRTDRRARRLSQCDLIYFTCCSHAAVVCCAAQRAPGLRKITVLTSSNLTLDEKARHLVWAPRQNLMMLVAEKKAGADGVIYRYLPRYPASAVPKCRGVLLYIFFGVYGVFVRQTMFATCALVWRYV